MIDRRLLLALSGMSFAGCASLGGEGEATSAYGRIGKVTSKSGSREALIEALLDGSRDMPGSISYKVARDVEDADAIWIIETWQDAASHKASLSLPQVRRAIAAGRPLIASFELSAELDFITDR